MNKKNLKLGFISLLAIIMAFSCGPGEDNDLDNGDSLRGCVDGGAALDGDSTVIIWDGNLCITNGVRVNLLKELGTRTDVIDLTKVGSTYYFVSQDDTHGEELWKSDGTKAGTMMVKDIQPGVGDSRTHGLTNVNGTLFFISSEVEELQNLWKSDGTEAGTVVVKEIFPFDSQGPGELTEMGGKLYFRAADKEKGIELWVSDGTEAGTKIVKNIQDDEPNDTYLSSSSPTNLVSSNSAVFFRIIPDPNVQAFDLWKTDGTDANTVLVKSFEMNINSPVLGDEMMVGDLLYFMVNQDDKNIRELWISDGTEAGTKKLKDITADSGHLRSEFTAVKGLLYFRISDNTKGLAELWKSDGTEAGTVLVKSQASWSPLNLISVNDLLFFTADADGVYQLLWRSDGTEAGTQPVGEGVEEDVQILGRLKNTLVFQGKAKERIDTSNSFLWKTDGSEAGTEYVAHR